MRGGGVVDYPAHKLFLNRLANLFLRVIFHAPLNDFTNAFKAYRRRVIEGCSPFLSPHFQSDHRDSPEDHRARLLLDGDSDHLAKPALGRIQTEDSGNGQPLPVHRAVLLAGEDTSRAATMCRKKQDAGRARSGA